MKAIVNVNKKWAIGRDGGLLVSIPEDMKFFRSMTRDKVVIMGRKTLESFPGKKPLKGRLNIVLTGDASHIPDESKAAADAYFADLSSPGLMDAWQAGETRPTLLAAANSLDDVLRFTGRPECGDAYIIGGASIYEKMLPYCGECIVTVNDADIPADTFFPDLDGSPEWKLAEKGELKEYNGIHYSFNKYLRTDGTGQTAGAGKSNL